MCRIAGIIDKNAKPEQLEKEVKAMCDVMKHGGPDDEGFYADGTIGLQFGHRRLALIDLSPGGHQPMLYAQDNLVITFNGEIYNYPELKQNLQEKGFKFITQSDTEVILAAYAAWGVESFKKLIGMFAFALHDKPNQLSYLVRDQAGIKPLYYATLNNCLMFASEIKAFLAGSFSYEEDKNWKTYFLAFGHIPHPFTTLKNVNSLPSGHFLSWNHELNTSKITSFKEVAAEKTIDENINAAAVINHQFNKAVINNLIADAQIGVFLSGGIDSSVITLIADRHVGENLKSLSINFEEKAFSEAKYQEIIAEKTHGKHNSYLVQEQDFNSDFQQIIAAMDQPTNDGINAWFINKYAKENGLKAVLSGIGADELFGGYPSFKRIKLIQNLKQLPRFLLKLSAALPSEKLKRIYYLSYKNPIGEYLFLRGFFIPQTIAKLLNLSRKEIDALFENFPLDKELNDLKGEERASWFETNLFMKNQLLKDTDFMSMSHGVEVRVPFLNQDFIKATNNINNHLRFQERPKGLLIAAFKDLLPEAIWNRPKMGFSFPLQQWFLKGGQITDEAMYGNDYSKKLIRKFKSGKMHWSKAFALYQVTKSVPNN